MSPPDNGRYIRATNRVPRAEDGQLLLKIVNETGAVFCDIGIYHDTIANPSNKEDDTLLFRMSENRLICACLKEVEYKIIRKTEPMR